MAEEFQESEVIFHHGGDDVDEPSRNYKAAAEKKKLKPNNNKNNSAAAAAPVSIPENVSRNSWLRYIDQSDFAGGDDDDGEMVPPHIIVGRRVAGKMMAFSVCTGNGRTLKGRDLSRVRNSVLRMTGFLET
ncbi:hypothetical protein ABFS82_13G090300 [Erythranthe guttata]|uniref:Senescence regulator S40 n=1 Tax=Erythranthe guttata TaxID=4155 RepID=A0A022QNU2_ERYGU|nr:PREDICTED: uncharacterized protein LOC105968568 [Erythranthe guttata]EYU28150.1 hypothetical protein MIMGU_mgv1a016216mg [Erythranthe guttata]|eukprot:XP_012848651.1 PREDICTED: uncharacterized protein LOC105968568 [Erythranthe guttata]